MACGSRVTPAVKWRQQAPVDLARIFFKHRLEVRQNIIDGAQERPGVDIIEIVAVSEVFFFQSRQVPSSFMLLKKSSIAAESELSPCPGAKPGRLFIADIQSKPPVPDASRWNRLIATESRMV